MKQTIRLVFMACIYLLASEKSNSQVFRAGFTLGAVSSDIAGIDSRNHTNFHKLGFIAGGIINAELNKKNMFQMEMNYVQKGTLQPPDSMNNGYYKLGIDYIEVPFIIRHRVSFTLGKKKIERFDWEAGASIGRMVHHSWILDNYPAPINLDNMNRTDASLLIGLNYNFSSHSCLNFRYTNSVIPAIKHGVIPAYLVRYYYNTNNNIVFQVSLKFIFGGSAEKNSATD